jgi:hypothetical protein
MTNQPKDSFWSIITSPFRLVGAILFLIVATPLFIMRKIWSPHLDAANGVLFKEVYMFIRYGNYKDDGSDY